MNEGTNDIHFFLIGGVLGIFEPGNRWALIETCSES